MQQVARQLGVLVRQPSTGTPRYAQRPHHINSVTIEPGRLDPAPVLPLLRPSKRRRRPDERRLGRILPLAAAIMGIAVFTLATLATGSPQSRSALPFDLEGVVADIGLGVDQVQIHGHRRTFDSVIFDAIGMDTVRSELSLDTRAIERRLVKLPWVLSATVARRYPGSLDIVVKERTPAAVMHASGRDVLLDIDGRLLGPAASNLDGRPTAGLIRIRGDGAHKDIARLASLFARHRGLADKVAVAERVAGRRWSLHLADGPVVLVPADAEGWSDLEAVAQVMTGPAGQRLIDRPFAVIDARLADRLVLRAANAANDTPVPF